MTDQLEQFICCELEAIGGKLLEGFQRRLSPGPIEVEGYLPTYLPYRGDETRR